MLTHESAHEKQNHQFPLDIIHTLKYINCSHLFHSLEALHLLVRKIYFPASKNGNQIELIVSPKQREVMNQPRTKFTRMGIAL